MQQLIKYWHDRFSINELSGSVGDLGTFLPIILMMSKNGVIDIGCAFFWTGVFNIVTGLQWDTPICVQPMKVIAAAAVSDILNAQSVASAGLITGIVVFILGFTNMIQFVYDSIPQYLIGAIQLCQGLKFINKGLEMIMGVNAWFGLDSQLITSLLALLILFTWCPWDKNSKNYVVKIISIIAQQTPTALIMTIVGFSISIQLQFSQISIEPSFPIKQPFYSTTKGDILTGLTEGAIPQLPLTILNSVISVVELNNQLFPDKLISVSDMAMSVGFMNIVTIWLGSVPNCHGSGGLAGQQRFGARTGLSVVILGLIKCIVGIILGNSLNQLIEQFPLSILGMMLMVTGGELASRGLSKKISEDDSIVFMIITGFMLYVNLISGFLVGLGIQSVKNIVQKLNETYGGQESQIHPKELIDGLEISENETQDIIERDII